MILWTVTFVLDTDTEPARLALSRSADNVEAEVAFGSRGNDICVLDIDQSQITYETKGE